MDTQLSLQVLRLLRETFMCTIDTQRQAVEQQLQALSVDWLNFLQTLLSVVLSQQDDVTPDLRASAASIILAKVRRLESQQAASAPLIFGALLHSQGREADLLTEAMETLLQTQDEEMTLARDFFAQLEPLYQAKPAVAFRLLRALFNAVGGTMLPFVPRALQILQGTGEVYLTSGVDPRILAEWTKAAEQIVKYALTDGATASALVNDLGLLNLLGKLLAFPNREGDMLLICSPADEIARDCILFLLRTVSALFENVLDRKQEELERIHGTKFSTISGFAAPDIPTTQLVSRLLEPLLCNLQSFCRLPISSTLLAQEAVSDLVVEALNLLTKACSDTLFYPFFAKVYEGVVVFLVPALLLRLPKETEDFEENPEEFVALALDLCENRESETPKSAAAHLLDMLASQVDGCLAFVANFYAQVVDFTVAGSSNRANYPLLIKSSESDLFLQLPEQDRMDVSLVALCSISALIGERNDLRLLVSSLISVHFTALARASSQLIRARMALLCMQFAGAFEAEAINNVAQMLEFLVFCLRPEETSKAVTIQAAEAIADIVRNPMIITCLESALPKIMTLFLSVAPSQTEKSFFEALEELLKSNSRQFVSLLPDILATLVEKILTEYRKDPRGLTSSSILVLKCWNILQVLCDCPDFNPSQLAVLEERLWPAFQLLGTAKLNFEDSICVALGYLIQRSKTITAMDWKLFEALPVVQSLSGGALGSLFFVLNQFILYSAEGLQKEPQRATQLFKMALDGLSACKGEKINEEEGAQAALLLHVLLTTYPGAFYDQYPLLFRQLFERYALATKQYFKVKIAEIVICAFAANPAYTASVLSQLPDVETLSCLHAALRVVLEALQWFKYAYDRRVAVVGLGSWLAADTLPVDLQSALPDYFLHVVRLMIEASQEKPKKKHKKRSKDTSSLVVKGTSVHIKLSSSESTEEKRLQMSLKTLSTPIKDLNESDHLRQALDKVRVFNPSLFNLLVGRLNSEQRTKLIAALQVCKVEGTEGLRKIVKTKRAQAAR